MCDYTWKRDRDSSNEIHSPRSRTGQRAQANALRHRPADPKHQPPARATSWMQGMGVAACRLTESSAWFAAEKASMSSTVSRASTISISSSRSSAFSIGIVASDMASVPSSEPSLSDISSPGPKPPPGLVSGRLFFIEAGLSLFLLIRVSRERKPSSQGQVGDLESSKGQRAARAGKKLSRCSRWAAASPAEEVSEDLDLAAPDSE